MDFRRHSQVHGHLLNGRYETISPLNHGSFGMVFVAKDHFLNKDVALKCLKKPSAGMDLEPSIKIDDRSEELEIHSRIGSHPNVVNLLNSFDTPTHSYLVLEYCSMGDLYEAIRLEKGPRETEHVRGLMLQLISAVEFIHSKGIYHRDIKPENIFLTGNGNMKLGDFGLATTDVWSYEIAVGSDRYMAPEQYDPAGNGLSPGRADVWSVGICLLNILFSKNPFGVPANEDPLFSDFVRDRQSLFDVFPNMSQDTFEVLIHCLAIDPAKRSLARAKEALERVISFTTDDESLDEFCTENREVVTATANREPLRTPSITSPNLGPNESFPWAKALQMSNMHSGRQLSAIKDNESVSEDLFPGSEMSAHDWYSKADTQSIESVVDSGLGLSIGSGFPNTFESSVSRSKPVPIAGSLPLLGGRGRGLSSFFGKKKPLESKSWSDLWDEEEEERLAQEQRQRSHHFHPSRLSTLSQEDSEDDGRSTPRACLTDLKVSSALNTRLSSQRNAKNRDDGVSEHTGFVLEDIHSVSTRPPLTPKHSSTSTSTPKRSLMDKWAALGDKRRGVNTPVKETPLTEPVKRKPLSSSWRRNIGIGLNRQYPDNSYKLDHGVWQKKEWSLSKDWRRSDNHLPKMSPPRPHASQLDGASDNSDDDETLWVGGWKDLHI